MEKQKTKLSIIVPSYNSKNSIKACLASIISEVGDSAEIIVVDSSNDGTDQIIKDGFTKIKIIHTLERKFAGQARNIGISHANGNIIAFIDSDCIVQPGWLANLLAAHKTNNVVVGSIINVKENNIFSWGLHFLEFSDFLSNRKKYINLAPSCNLSIKKETLQKAGGFPEIMFGEDFPFCDRLNEKLLYDPNIIIHHKTHPEAFGNLGYAYKLGRFALKGRKKAGDHKSLLVCRFPILAAAVPFKRAGLFLSRFKEWDKKIKLKFVQSSWFLGILLLSYSWGVFLEATKLNRDLK